MKKVNFKNVFMTLAVFLAFFLVGTSSATAQNEFADGLISVPQGNFVSNGEAEVALDAKMLDLKTSAIGASQQTMQAIEKQAAFYQSILDYLDIGTVAESIVNGVQVLVSDQYDAKLDDVAALKDEAVDLLSN